VLRLGKLTDYATVMAARMAREPGRVFAASELAAASQVGVPTASKILKLLTRAQLLNSVRGAKGGYVLARPAGEISLGEVVAALEGPPGLTECSTAAGLCTQEGCCAIRGHWQAIDQVLRNALDHTTLADLSRPVPATEFVPIVVPAPARQGQPASGGKA
jgi:FeS assembly SUF system regulator